MVSLQRALAVEELLALFMLLSTPQLCVDSYPWLGIEEIPRRGNLPSPLGGGDDWVTGRMFFWWQKTVIQQKAASVG